MTPHPNLPGPASSLPGSGGGSVVLAGGAPRQGGADTSQSNPSKE